MKMNNVKVEKMLHYIMCFVGGWLAAYAIFLRGGNLGSAQTGNLLRAMLDVVEGEWWDLLLRLGACAVYIIFLAIAYLIPMKGRYSRRRICFVLEAAGIILAALIPQEADPILALYPIFAITAFQWTAFSGAAGYEASTVFITGDIRQMVYSWTEYIKSGNEKMKEKGWLYADTVLFYLGGILTGYYTAVWMGISSVFLCLIPLAAAAVLNRRNEAADPVYI